MASKGETSGEKKKIKMKDYWYFKTQSNAQRLGHQ